MSQQSAQPGQVEIDGSKPVTLNMSTHAAAFLLQLLGSQGVGVVTQVGQQNLLADLDKQLSAQHGLGGPKEATVPAGAAQPLPAANRQQRRRAK